MKKVVTDVGTLNIISQRAIDQSTNQPSSLGIVFRFPH